MKLAPEDQVIARQALNRVLERAQSANDAGDIESALAILMSTRDAIVSAAITLRAVADATRSRAMRTLEREPA